MHARIIRAATTATVPVPAGQRVRRASLKNGAKNVTSFYFHRQTIRRRELPSSGLHTGNLRNHPLATREFFRSSEFSFWQKGCDQSRLKIKDFREILLLIRVLFPKNLLLD